MTVLAYKQIQNETSTDIDLSRRVIQSVLSYIKDCSNFTLSETQRIESLLNAHTLCSGALLSLSRNPETEENSFLFNVFDFAQEEFIKDIRRQGNGNLHQIETMFQELNKHIS